MCIDSSGAQKWQVERYIECANVDSEELFYTKAVPLNYQWIDILIINIMARSFYFIIVDL